MDNESKGNLGRGALTLGALGVVYGDIGTSPLYTVQTIFNGTHPIALDQSHIYGGLSLVFWSLMLVVTIKYVTVVMRASNEGEGGILALIALLRGFNFRNKKAQGGLIALGILGASLFYGDALITPAISVLSAVEGLKVPAPGLTHFVIPITLIILCVLFATQHYGTNSVGRVFGPVMLVWFVVLAVLGVGGIAQHPAVLVALSPTYGAQFLFDNGFTGYLILGAVVLAVTGAEALYADMGHFGRKPITHAWLIVVLPSLLLNYFGQGAMLLKKPATIDNPFFRLAPGWAQLPLVLLATVATVIASQAVISGAFSLSWQALRLGYLPFMQTKHTSDSNRGQVYLPGINGFLLVAVIIVVLSFGSSASLASAYGLAVTGTFSITTILLMVVAHKQWGVPLWLTVVLGGLMLLVDLTFFTSNLAKLIHGGWFPLLVAACLFVLLSTWRKGRAIVLRKRHDQEGLLTDFVAGLSHSASPPVRVDGTAIFLNASSTATPLGLKYNVEHNHVLHKHVIVLTVETTEQPHTDIDDRIALEPVVFAESGIQLVKARFGFADEPDVPSALAYAAAKFPDIDLEKASYFVTRTTLAPGKSKEMRQWRKLVFISLNRNGGSSSRLFCLPDDRVVVLGASVSL